MFRPRRSYYTAGLVICTKLHIRVSDNFDLRPFEITRGKLFLDASETEPDAINMARDFIGRVYH